MSLILGSYPNTIVGAGAPAYSCATTGSPRREENKQLEVGEWVSESWDEGLGSKGKPSRRVASSLEQCATICGVAT
jgi:hypothetical protein